MKKLSIQPKLNENQINFLEGVLGVPFPKQFKEFITIYCDTATYENTYTQSNKLYKVSMFCTYRMIFDFINDLKRDGFEKRIPFAVDDGGWVYCISMNESRYGKVYLFQLEMPYENENEAFEFVANSFEEFINGLQAEREVN